MLGSGRRVKPKYRAGCTATLFVCDRNCFILSPSIDENGMFFCTMRNGSFHSQEATRAARLTISIARLEGGNSGVKTR